MLHDANALHQDDLVFRVPFITWLPCFEHLVAQLLLMTSCRRAIIAPCVSEKQLSISKSGEGKVVCDARMGARVETRMLEGKARE